MKKLRYILAPLALSLIIGCESENSVSPSPSNQPSGESSGTPLFVKDMNMVVEKQIEPQRLESLLDALRREGREIDAERVSATYDLATGTLNEKYLPPVSETGKAVATKLATWDPQSNLKYQTYENGAYLPYVRWGQTCGQTVNSAQNGFIRISYDNSVGAPLLSFNVSNYFGNWSSAESWNQQAGWPDATGYPMYGLWQLKITTTTALGTNHWYSTYRVFGYTAGWGAWFSQGQAAGNTGPTGKWMTAFEYKINYI